jgi:hypothetical protein
MERPETFLKPGSIGLLQNLKVLLQLFSLFPLFARRPRPKEKVDHLLIG